MRTLLILFLSCTLLQAEPASKGFSTVLLKLLEPLAPKKTDKGEESVASTLGELLNDPKNEALKQVKVIGKQKQVVGEGKNVTQITWQEVALEVAGGDHPQELKEPVEKPMQSAFVQKSDIIQPGTPIEAKGDVDSLLAAARSLMLRAQKQGLKGQPLTQKGQTLTNAGLSEKARPASAQESKKTTINVETGSSPAPPFASPPRSESPRSHSEPSSRQNSFNSSQSPYGATPRSSPSTPGFNTSYSSGGSYGFSPNTPFTTPRRQERREEGQHFHFSSPPQTPPRAESTRETAEGTPLPRASTPQAPETEELPENETRETRGAAEGEHDTDDTPFSTPLRGSQGDGEQPQAPSSEIRVDYDYSSCAPRIDWNLKRVVLQAKAITFQGGVRMSETECLDMGKQFSIKKDYSCTLCQDVVERNASPTGTDLGFAYATYQPYWLNESSQRQYLKDPQKDEQHPFALQEEPGKCVYALDLTAKTATPQSELTYYNRSKQRVVAEGCRPSLGATPLSITATRQGCGVVHQFDRNRSMPQQRLVYSVDGTVHEAAPCHDQAKWLKHHYDFASCKPIVDGESKTYQKFAKRYIFLERVKTYISECEPHGDQTPLLLDEAACADQPYTHDLAAGQSFVNGRWYYPRQHGPKYVSLCQPTTQSFTHRKRLMGYEFNDEARTSRPKVEVYFERDGRKVVVVPSQVEGEPVPYVATGEEVNGTPYQRQMVDRCHQEQKFAKKALYQRADQTVLAVPLEDQVQTVDLCQRSTEQMLEASHVSFFKYTQPKAGRGRQFGASNQEMREYPWGYGFFRYYPDAEFTRATLYSAYPSNGYLWKTAKILERIKTIFPDGTFEHSPWAWTGIYKDHSLSACHSGWDNLKGEAGIPYQEREWRDGDRLYARISW